MWLSVICRRVLFANTAVVGVLGVLTIAHFALANQSRMIASFFIAVIGELPIDSVMRDVTWSEVSAWALGELGLFVLFAALFTWLAFRKFAHRDYTGH